MKPLPECRVVLCNVDWQSVFLFEMCSLSLYSYKFMMFLKLVREKTCNMKAVQDKHKVLLKVHVGIEQI